MRTEWFEIGGIQNLLWVPSTWLSQPSSISSPEQVELVEAEWKKCFYHGPNSPDNSYTSVPSMDYQLEIPGEDEQICSYAAYGAKHFFIAYTVLFDQL
jgi:hypothetical protein